MGLIHGTISDKGAGLTAVVPANYIKETIENAPGYDGTYKFRYENNILWSERISKNGIPWTVESNYKQDGSSQEKGSLRNGNGTLFVYDVKGTLIEVRYYKNGHLEKIENKNKSIR